MEPTKHNYHVNDKYVSDSNESIDILDINDTHIHYCRRAANGHAKSIGNSLIRLFPNRIKGFTLVDPTALPSVWDTQTGGTHYSRMKIQPSKFCRDNNINFHEGCVIKRMCRHAFKAGAEDCKKAIDEIRAILEEDYGVRSKLEIDKLAYDKAMKELRSKQ